VNMPAHDSILLLCRRRPRVERSASNAEKDRGEQMSAVVGPIIAAVVGAVIAGGAAFGIISSQSAVPATVDAPYVVYGSTN